MGGAKNYTASIKNIAAKSYLACLLIVVLSSVIFLFIIFSSDNGKKIPHLKSHDNSQCTDDKSVALTFDDGPSVERSADIIGILKTHDVPATFFLTGSKVLDNTELVKYISDQGFAIGNHTFTHSRSVHSSKLRLFLELEYTSLIYEMTIGYKPVNYRPPYLMGIDSSKNMDPVVRFASENLGYNIIGADADAIDWSAESVDKLIDNLAKSISNGPIALLHDDGLHTLDALNKLIGLFKDNGYKFISLNDVLSCKKPNDNNYVYDMQVIKTSDTALGFADNVSLKLVKRYFVFPYIKFIQVISGIVIFIIYFTLIFQFSRLILLIILTVWPQVKSKARNQTVFSHRQHKKTITIIIPVHNEERSIVRCLDSIWKSTTLPCECIVVNDGSTDLTLNEIEGYSVKYESQNIKIITIEKSGKVSALNEGLKASRGDIVVTVDGDTVLNKFALERLTNHFVIANVKAVAGRLDPVVQKGFLKRFQQLEYAVAQSVEKKALSNINALSVLPGALTAWDKKYLLDSELFSSRTVTEDRDKTLCLLHCGYKVLYDDDAFCFTEAPKSHKQFITQRYRWMLGSMQCVGKHITSLFSFRRPTLGFIVFPQLLIENIILPLLYPIVDAIIICSVLLGEWKLLFYYLFAVAIEVLLTLILVFNRGLSNMQLLKYIPLKFVYYRMVAVNIMFNILRNVAMNRKYRWTKLERTGAVGRIDI